MEAYLSMKLGVFELPFVSWSQLLLVTPWQRNYFFVCFSCLNGIGQSKTKFIDPFSEHQKIFTLFCYENVNGAGIAFLAECHVGPSCLLLYTLHLQQKTFHSHFYFRTLAVIRLTYLGWPVKVKLFLPTKELHFEKPSVFFTSGSLDGILRQNKFDLDRSS